MGARRARATTPGEGRNSRLKWLEEGLRILATRGPGGVTIDAVGQRLGLTKGSFYHYFGSRQGYRKALLRHWEEEMTVRLIEATGATGAERTPRGRLDRLGDLATGLENAALERAIRAWAAQDAEVAAVQERVDRARLDHLKVLVRAALGERAAAAQVATILYAVYVGAQHVRPAIDGESLRRLLRRLRILYEPTAGAR